MKLFLFCDAVIYIIIELRRRSKKLAYLAESRILTINRTFFFQASTWAKPPVQPLPRCICVKPN